MFSFGRNKRSKGRKLIVDVGTQYVKVVDLVLNKNQATLNNFRILNLIKDGRRFVPKEISKIIKKSILDMGIQEKHVHCSLAGKSVLVRLLDLPKMSQKELKSSLRYQTDLHVPFSLDDANFDAVILDDPNAAEGRVKVLVAAAPRKESGRVLEVVRGAGLLPRKLDVDAIALCNAFDWGLAKPDKNAYALVNIGASRTNVTVLQNRNPKLCRDLNYGGISCTEAIVSGMGISFDEAEEKKIMGDAGVMNHIEEALKPLANGLQQSIDFFEGSSGIHLEKVYLSGGSALIRGVMEFLKASLDRPVVMWDTLRGINTDALGEREKELLQSNSPLLTIALGIGLGEGESKHDQA